MRQGEVMCSSASRGFTLTCLLVLLVASLPVMGQAQPAPFSSTALCSTVDELAFDGDQPTHPFPAGQLGTENPGVKRISRASSNHLHGP